MMLMGSSFIGFIIVILMNEVMTMQNKCVMQTQALYQQIDVNCSGVIEVEELEDWFNNYMPDKIAKDDIKMLFDEIDTDGNGQIEPHEFADYMLNGFGRRTYCMMFIYFLRNWKMAITFWTWILIGTVFLSTNEGYSFVRSAYYAVTACSTGGLHNIPMKDWVSKTWAFYILVGIPMYAITLSTGAAWVMRQMITERLDEEIRLAREQSTREVCTLLKSCLADGVIDGQEFLQLQLLRRQNPQFVSFEWLEEQRTKFEELDEQSEKDGNCSLKELVGWDPSLRRYLVLATDRKFMASGGKQDKQRPNLINMASYGGMFGGAGAGAVAIG